MSTITFKRCEACGGVNCLDDTYKCSNCAHITSPDKAIHIKDVENDDTKGKYRGGWSSHRMSIPAFSSTYVAMPPSWMSYPDGRDIYEDYDFEGPDEPPFYIKGLRFD